MFWRVAMGANVVTVWEVGERWTDRRVGARRWSIFQIVWAALHALAMLMHVASVVYHVKRVTERGQESPSLLDAGRDRIRRVA